MQAAHDIYYLKSFQEPFFKNRFVDTVVEPNASWVHEEGVRYSLVSSLQISQIRSPISRFWEVIPYSPSVLLIS